MVLFVLTDFGIGREWYSERCATRFSRMVNGIHTVHVKKPCQFHALVC
jgi:hypothetical protein